MVVSDAERTSSTQVRKSRSSLPTIGIYRPPAARRSTEDSSKASADSVIVESSAKDAVKPARARVRRPDQQVYVPRAKRAFTDSERFEDPTPSSVENRPPRISSPSADLPCRDKIRSGNLIIEDRKSCKPRSSSPSGWLPARASQLVETKKKLCQSTSSDLDLEGISRNIPPESDKLSSTMNPSQSLNLPPRAEVLVEKKKKLCQSSSLTEDFKWKPKEEVEQDINAQLSADYGVNSEETSTHFDKDEKCSKNSLTVISESEITSVIDTKVTSSVSEENKCDIVQLDGSPQSKLQETSIPVLTRTVSKDSLPSNKGSVMRGDSSQSSEIKCVQGSSDSSDDDYQDTNTERKCNGLTNISDQSSGGSSESLSSTDSLNAHVTPVQLMKPVKTEPKKKSSEKPARVFNPDECDWDALLDEDGDVLDPFLMKELTSAVGEVQVNQPKSDYRNYRSQVPADHQKTRRSAGDDDFGHVVEISSFPPEFKTPDLVAVLSPFKNMAGGFEIKWVDDTHALGVFASALIAEQVLAYHHPMVRTRPLCDATLESRLKARRLSESIHSFRPRPETCAALARRLVTGALGVKLPTARQEREEEKRVLREAREKRRLAVQQQDDIWNS
ncbi:uncharacterized protein LOC113201695 [Frankliniella occidentalis]|uniref:Uncharacterized protein LOC113201695 n=1 Tax=Frankliniella occidentalis TaxID=133901 RepID=A0A6J1RQS8_FRAOC|nr:uncharacterized protein LOC113201695 [Frankliniella occidentalis]